MSIATFVACACMLALALAGCGLEDNFDPEMLRHTVSWSCFASAPIVVVATINEVQQVGPARRARKGDITLDPIRLRIAVENILKGTVHDTSADLYAFQYSRTLSSFPGKTFQPRPGERRLFLLRSEGSRLLLYVDEVRDFYYPQLWTGRHAALDTSVSNDPNKAIAWILLSPGDGFDRAAFRGRQLSWAAWVAAAVTKDKDYVFSLLDILRNSPDRELREDIDGMKDAIDSHFHDGRWSDPTPSCPQGSTSVP